VHVHNTWFSMSPAVLPPLAAAAPVVMTLHNYRLTCANGLLFRDGGVCEQCVGSHPWHGVAHACYRGSRAQSVFPAATIAWNRRRGTWTDAVDRFVALTEFGKHRFVTAGLPADRIVVKPHFTADPGPRRHPPSASDEVVYVGRLAPEKGVDTVVSAMARLGSTRLRLVVIGDGPELARLRRGAPPTVTFTGPLDPRGVTSRLLGARALLFPSLWYETFGLTLIEALAAGVPVVATAHGAAPGIIGDGGITVEPGDVAAWTDGLRRLFDDAFVDEAGRRARRLWHARYRPQVGLAALEQLYRQALAAPVAR
jgi:glycosyltransferase involved in cell wall biosynthesis